MELKKLYGVIPPMVTPFDANEEINMEVLKQEASLLFNAGIHGISLGGSTGEGALLSNQELASGIELIQKENINKVPVLCGIIRNSTKDAVAAGLASKNAGADVLMVTPTFYHGTDARGNYAYYERISAEVGLPIVIYNVIKNNPITPDMMQDISTIDNVVGIKQSVGGIHSLADMIQFCGDKTLVFGAQDDLMYLSYALGAVGAISAILTVFPELCVQQWDYVQAGDYEQAKAIHSRLLPVWRKIDCGMAFPGMIKAALKLMGREVGSARSPIIEPDATTVNKLKITLNESGFTTV